jgi:hypothetical protein
MSDKPFVLPPLPSRPSYHWLEGQLLHWQERIARRRAGALPGGKRVGFAVAAWTVRRFLRSGRKFPLLYRFWYALGWVVLSAVPAGRETSSSIVLRRAFKRGVAPDPSYRGDYVAFNVLTVLVALCVAYFVIEPVGEGAYILTTYQHNKYTDVTVTSHYRDFTQPHLFAVHGYETLKDGEQRELFFEIKPSFWFQDYNSEFVFGKISDNAVCNIDAYGTLLRIPLAFRYLSKDSLYALNPWIVDVRCKTPTLK